MLCTVMKNLHTLNVWPLLALAGLFIKIPGSVSLHPVLTGPGKAYLRSRVAFRCMAPDSSPPITYQLLRNSVPVATGTDPQGDQPAIFFLKVATTSEGSYQCRATAAGRSGVSDVLPLSVVIPASDTRVTSEPFPPHVYEGARIVLRCNVTRGSHLSYGWFFNRKEVIPSNSTLFHLAGNALVMERASVAHTGRYSCMAWSEAQGTRRFSSSNEVQVTIKAYISKPKISFSVLKEGDGYQGNVSCWSTRGSPPANFSVSIDNRAVDSVTVNQSLSAWFLVEVVPGLDMGVARCLVQTGAQDLMSEPVTLEVVPVGGEVKVEVEYLYGANSAPAAARLRCMVHRGTFPHFSWFLNGSTLPSQTHASLPHAALGNRQTLVLTKMAAEESGYYRCRVRDSYHDSGPWVESGEVLVTDRILNSSTETPPQSVTTITIEIITIIFCCFLFLALLVGVVCVYCMFEPSPAHGRSAMTDSCEALPLSAPWSQAGEQQGHASSTHRLSQIREITV